jgi:predicted enzyme related to lactoylglutathione lyase
MHEAFTMSEKSLFSNRGLGLLVIFAQNMGKSVEFYRSLGLQFEQHTHPPCGDHFSSIDDGCVLEICQSRKGQQSASPMTFGFCVSCVERAVQGVSMAGGTVKREPHDAEWGRSATVSDPDGNCVLLMEKR